MRFEIYNWASDSKAEKVIKALGYEHRQIVEGDVLRTADDFLANGVNVMILHAGSLYTLAVDSKTFGQR